MCVVKRFDGKQSELPGKLAYLIEQLPEEYIPMLEGYIQGIIDSAYEIKSAENG